MKLRRTLSLENPKFDAAHTHLHIFYAELLFTKKLLSISDSKVRDSVRKELFDVKPKSRWKRWLHLQNLQGTEISDMCMHTCRVTIQLRLVKNQFAKTQVHRNNYFWQRNFPSAKKISFCPQNALRFRQSSYPLRSHVESGGTVTVWPCPPQNEYAELSTKLTNILKAQCSSASGWCPIPLMPPLPPHIHHQCHPR